MTPSTLNRIFITALVASAIGFVDSFYLTVEHFLNAVPPCSVGGCETVLTSSYSKIAGIPVALLGTLFFVAMILLEVLFLVNHDHKILRLFAYGSVLGIIAAAWFVFCQLFLLHAICAYCLMVESASLMLFVIGWLLFKRGFDATQTI